MLKHVLVLSADLKQVAGTLWGGIWCEFCAGCFIVRFQVFSGDTKTLLWDVALCSLVALSSCEMSFYQTTQHSIRKDRHLGNKAFVF
jgi:hypothetical protein